MKTFLFLILGFGFITGLLLYSGSKNCTLAKTYGPTSVCPADKTKKVQDFYPGKSISSMDIHVVVLGTNIPAGTTFTITAKADVEACSSVKCLARKQTKTTNAYTQGAVLQETLDEIGCGGAGSGCSDAATVTVASNPTLTGCTWSYSDNGAANSFVSNTGSKPLTLANGTEKSMYFMLTCTPPNPPACISLTKNARAGNGGLSAQGMASAGASINLFANIENDNNTRVSSWSSSCGSFTSKNWDFATWKAPNTPGTCFISYSLNGENQPGCNGNFTIPTPVIESPTPTITTPPIGGSTSTPTLTPSPTVTPVKTLTPTVPVGTQTPTVTIPFCPAVQKPVVRINCPQCTN